MGKLRTPVILTVTALSPGALPSSPRMHIATFQSPAGLDSALLPGGRIHPSSPSGALQGAGFQLFSLATPWESACCDSCVSSPLVPMGVYLSSLRLLCLAHFLLSCRIPAGVSDCLAHGFASDHLLCLCPHLLVLASLLKWLRSASSEPQKVPLLSFLIS